MGQRNGRRGLRPLLMLAASIAATASAHAEQLLMPYACDARGGEVRLTPSDQRAYQIYGRREHHIFTVCAPTDQSRCRNWMIHRFYVDCGGERVSWLQIADVARRFARADAFVEDGTMHIHVGPHLAAGGDGPYSDRRWARRAERFDPAEIIDLPSGFAPAFGLPVSFEGGSGPRDSFDAVEGPPPAAKRYGDNADWPDERAYTPDGARRADTPDAERRYAQGSPGEDYRHEDDNGWNVSRQPVPVDKSAPVDVPVKKPPQAVQSPAQKAGSTSAAASNKSAQSDKTAVAKAEVPKVETPKPEAAKPAAPKAETAVAEPPKPAAPQSEQGPITPTILNAPGAAKLAAAEAAAPPAEATPSAAPLPAPEKAPPPTASKEQPAASAEQPAKTETTIPVIGLPSPSGSGQSQFAFAQWHWLVAVGGAASLLALAWLLLTRRNAGYDASLPRDLSAISLDGGFAAGTSLVPRVEPALPASIPGSAGSALSPVPPKAEIRMPATLSDALEVLGVSADAGPGVLKKIVDGLRQSWHPDLARSDEDRRYREQRMAQINVAWDIIEASLRPAA